MTDSTILAGGEHFDVIAGSATAGLTGQRSNRENTSWSRPA